MKDSQDWADISTKVFDATQAFKDEVDLINQEGWTGYTHEAAMDNIGKSYAEPETASGGAGVMAFLVEAFEETIWATKENIVSKKESYELLTDYYEDHRRDGVINTYNDFARKVMVEVYTPNIEQIAMNAPIFTAGETLEVDPLPDPGLVDPNSPGGVEGLENSTARALLTDRSHLPRRNYRILGARRGPT